jgi:hypothetical protein
MRAPAIAIVLLGVFGGGCRHSQDAEPPQFHYGTYQLFLLSQPSADPLPEAFVNGERAFAEARAAYDRGEYLQAASGFMTAAETLRVREGEPFWEIARRNRVWCYRNAAYSWAMANALDKLRPAIEAAIKSDPWCADELRQLLAKPPAPHH